jgi:hypothetical protein
MDLPLNGTPNVPGEPPEPAYKELKDTSKGVANFLTKYPSARIIVVIDTHCLDNGYFVYTGTSPATYLACSLQEVSATLIVQLTSTSRFGFSDSERLHST